MIGYDMMILEDILVVGSILEVAGPCNSFMGVGQRSTEARKTTMNDKYCYYI
jgi:hypothetical protein